MDAGASSNLIGQAILKSLGISAARVSGLSLDCVAGKPATLILRMHPPSDFSAVLDEELKHYKLAPIDAQEPPAAA